MPASPNPVFDNETQANQDVQEAAKVLRTLTPDQLREVARKLYEMMRRDLRLERARPQ